MSICTGLIFDIQRFCTGDGPGIRTTVFLKGCPLSCIWCHNPESQSSQPQIAFYQVRCINCGSCVRACTSGAMRSAGEITREACIVCGQCTEVCAAQALQMIGREVCADEVVGEALRDKPFFESSGGGVTLSGGEPLHQLDFVLQLLRAFREEGVHTALETCGLASWNSVSQVAELVDLFLFDIKAADADRHRELCGADNKTIVQNLRKLSEAGSSLLIRYPLIPDSNDRAGDIEALADLVLSLGRRHELQLMPYNGAGDTKYRALGLKPPSVKATVPDETLQRTLAALKARGVAVALDI